MMMMMNSASTLTDDSILYDALMRLFGSPEQIEESGILEQDMTPEMRMQIGELDIMYFAQYYFAHHCTAPPSQMHFRFAKEIREFIESPRRGFKLVVWPRGFAKTTWATLITPAYCIAYNKRKYIIMVSDTQDQAKAYLETLKDELQSNERMLADFGSFVGDKWQSSCIICTHRKPDPNNRGFVTTSRIQVEAMGIRQKMRGRKFGNVRPDFVLGDDMENTIAVQSPVQRHVLERAINRDILKALAPDGKFLGVGNLIHHESLLATLLKHGMFDRQKHKAIIEWPTHMDMWDHYIALKRDKDSLTSQEDAAEYLAANYHKMHKGAVVAWPEFWPLIRCMDEIAASTMQAFQIEMQNDTLADTDRKFTNLRKFKLIEEKDGHVYIVPADGSPIVRLDDCLIIGGCDPSLGLKKTPKPDPSAIVIVAKPKGPRVFVLKADIKVRHYSELIKAQAAYGREYAFADFGIEAVQFQALFADKSMEDALKQGSILPVRAVQQAGRGSKVARILGLEPLCTQGLVLFNEFGCETLLSQLENYSPGSQDDGPDALEIAVRLAVRYDVKPANSESVVSAQQDISEKTAQAVVKTNAGVLNQLTNKPSRMSDKGWYPRMVR